MFSKASPTVPWWERVWKSCNNPESLATTVLGIMVKCLFGGPTILCKMIPVCRLNANFLFEQVTRIIEIINSSNGQVFVVIVDNNLTNQNLFESFNRVKGKPWLTEDGLYLIYDYEHFLQWRVQARDLGIYP